MHSSPNPGLGVGQRWLDAIERTGNRLPAPAMLFVYLCGLVLLASWLCASLGLETVLPGKGTQVEARNLLSSEGLSWMLTSLVGNFVNFAPVGTVLVMMLGFGVAEHSGLLRVLLTRLVLLAPPVLLTWVVVFTGILSSLAFDVGYVVVIPLGAMLFAAAGRPPLVGLAAAFAGVSAGYSANLAITPADVLLAGISTEAVALLSPGYQVSILGNFYFTFASTFLLSLVGTWVTHRWLMPWALRSGKAATEAVEALPSLTPQERRGLRAVLIWTLLLAGLLVLALLPGGPLRVPGEGLMASPAVKGMVPLIAFYTAIAGWLFGRFSGRYQSSYGLIEGMESSMATLASYLVLMFFAAQFVSFFAWSQMGTLLAVGGANFLGSLNLGQTVLLLAFVLLAAVINLFIGSASAKWALMAPVFVPMLMLLGISPEATQMAFRIGDSATNIITPLMPYFGLVVAFAQRHQKDIGMGSLVALMLPYSLAFLGVWTVFFVLWIGFGVPLGPGVEAFVPGL